MKKLTKMSKGKLEEKLKKKELLAFIATKLLLGLKTKSTAWFFLGTKKEEK